MSRFKYGINYVLPVCLVSIPENIVGVFTLGYYVPSWSIQLICYLNLNRLKNKHV